jgi:hypothetical protein
VSKPNHKIEMEVMWKFNLTGKQARLVLAALGGRLRPDQYEDARKLGDELTILRAQHAGQLADELDIHAGNVQS